MSDMLDRLLQTERNAAEMVSSAEAEANRRKAETRGEAQKRHAAALKEKAADVDRAVTAEKERAVRERQEKNEEYRTKIASHHVDREGFFPFLSKLIGKGGQ
jgi:regulator of protease activity HflC (stomatin/prohibitin superfamily)